MTFHQQNNDAAQTEEDVALRMLCVALGATVVFHGGLLPFTHGNTYDAFIHMFFGDHYNRSWFDPWEPRWYTGFATTSYPPGTHMAIATLMKVLPIRAAFVLVLLTGLLLLVVGVFRFSLIWVPPRAAGYAALASVMSSGISETVHLFGQLPTIFSLGIFLNGMPYVDRWISIGGWRNCAIATIYAAATTAAHHVTTIFGGALFVVPLGLRALAWAGQIDQRNTRTDAQFLAPYAKPIARGGLLAILMLISIVLTVLPYWLWSVNDPITQVPIPHGSRESFLERPDLGIVFFLIPWGVFLLFLPYAIYKTATTNLWPLGAAMLLCLILGTGGTTPLPQAILRGAFDILTLDRFTFWATILILPFVGLMFDGILHGRSGRLMQATFGHGWFRILLAGTFIALTLMAVFPAVLPQIQRLQPKFVDPTPIVRFLAEDEHNRWRYLTLGMGDQFAYLSAQTDAMSVDGNYHSARRLPDLTSFSVERLENAKFMGVPGLGSLKQFLVNAERYNLKFVFSNDTFYDPLLHFTGWSRLNRLPNGIVVWEKPDVPPLPLFLPKVEIPPIQAVMWGIFPPLALLLAGSVFVVSVAQRNISPGLPRRQTQKIRNDNFPNPRRVRVIILGMGLAVLLATGATSFLANKRLNQPLSVEQVIAEYFEDLSFRRYENAFERLDPLTRGSFEDVRFAWRWNGGLIASYGGLEAVTAHRIEGSETIVDWRVELDWITALDIRSEVRVVRTVKRDGKWYLTPLALRPVQTPVRLQREAALNWNVVGRRQPRPETDLHRDRLDRPRIGISGARLVHYADRFSVVGEVTNADADPAAVTILSDLRGDTRSLQTQAAGTVNGDRLLPAESAGFRVTFEGVLSLEDALSKGSFDPTLFIPPEFSERPVDAEIAARALVAGKDLYRGVSLNAVSSHLGADRLTISGLAVNTGTKTSTISRINVLLYDQTGAPLWADAGYVETNIYPGQSAPFSFSLPLARDVSVIQPVTEISINGSVMETDIRLPGYQDGTLPLSAETGYSAARLLVTSMTHDPLF